ncbi:unnamed protein product [Amoebophrya sp. A120]|nr:unnamed protein product [Amoebophrya sp. A120]|eukprot:GSA120T00002662001.1
MGAKNSKTPTDEQTSDSGLSKPAEKSSERASSRASELSNQRSPAPRAGVVPGATTRVEELTRSPAAEGEENVPTAMEGSEASSLGSYNMAESIGVAKCLDLLLFAPDELKVFGEALSLIAGNADNESDFPLEEDLWELAKEKLAAVITPTMRLIHCKTTMVQVIKKFVDRKTRAVVNKAEILPFVRTSLLHQVTELLTLAGEVTPETDGGKFAPKDYWVWSTVASTMNVPEISTFPVFPLAQERTAICKVLEEADPLKYSACAKGICRDMHVLTNLPAYLEYEESLPFEKARFAKTTSEQAKKALRGQLARRVLLNAIPERTALSLVPGGFDSVDKIMMNAEKTCEIYCAQPLIIPVFKEQKKKGGKAEPKTAPAEKKEKAAPAKKEQTAAPAKKEAAPAAAPAPNKKAAASPKDTGAPAAKKPKCDGPAGCPPKDGELQKLRTDELGSALYYRYVLSHQNEEGGSTTADSGEDSLTPEIPCKKFDIVWSGRGIPQGQTEYSFRAKSLSGPCQQEVVDKASFGRVWAAVDGNVPQGHTTYSFFHGTGTSSSSSSAAPAPATSVKAAVKEQPKAPAPAAAPKNAGKGGQKAAEQPAKAAPAKAKAPAAAAAPAGEGDVGEAVSALQKLDLRVGQIVQVDRIPNSEALYKLQVDMGEGITRQICSGIVKFYPDGEKDLLNRKVITYFNIKPAKLAGEASEGMILAGAIDNKGPNEQCELLQLENPDACAVGTKITLKGCLEEVGAEAATTSLKNISKQWAKAQPLFSIDNSSKAFFAGKHQWVVKGKDGGEVAVLVPSLKNAGIF